MKNQKKASKVSVMDRIVDVLYEKEITVKELSLLSEVFCGSIPRVFKKNTGIGDVTLKTPPVIVKESSKVPA